MVNLTGARAERLKRSIGSVITARRDVHVLVRNALGLLGYMDTPDPLQRRFEALKAI